MTRLWLAAFLLLAVASCASAPSADDGAKDDLRAAIERNWNIPIGVSDLEKCTASLRLHLTPEGVVTKIDVLQENDDPDCNAVAESARRAVLMTQNELGHLPIPPDQYKPTITVRWPMKQICEQRGGC
ncbi:hypothetical protein [Dongia sp.]|uniref:hypothetical protein n=1 Tax=Dongia sp. TaxID=1977262 RepID=UPI0037515B0C